MGLRGSGARALTRALGRGKTGGLHAEGAAVDPQERHLREVSYAGARCSFAAQGRHQESACAFMR
jgi:hypothetical protein